MARGIEAEAAIAVVLPGPAGQGLGPAAPADTKVYYTRSRVAPTRASEMQKIVDHYESRTRGTRIEDRQKKILWYDGVKRNSDGTIETMDVVIEQVQNQNPGGPQGAVTFTIEVIVVVAKDPKAPAGNAVTGA